MEGRAPSGASAAPGAAPSHETGAEPCRKRSRASDADGSHDSGTAPPPPPPPSGRRVCLGVSGSVAAVKVAELSQALLDAGCEVEVVYTHSGKRLASTSYQGGVPSEKVAELARGSVTPLTTFVDADEWEGYNSVGSDPVQHIDISKRCDLLLIAPLCANTLGCIAAGLCPNLLTSVVRAWPFGFGRGTPESVLASEKPVVVAPAMNTVMWHQGVTAEHLQVLEAKGVAVVEPAVKKLACGDTGKGAMAAVGDIVRRVVELLPPAGEGK